MEQYGNVSTYNIESVLVQNIKESHYFVKQAMDCDTVYDLIDEIYETVDHVEPWLSGNARGPSSAFCLLFRLGQLKPSAHHVHEMLDHKDSPYIRALGFLYLRYVCNPKELWEWFRDYVKDEESFSPSPAGHGKTITIGTFARDILLDQYYFETIFPRIPKLVSDDIKVELKNMGLATEALGNGGQGGGDRRGGGSSARPASVKASLSVAFAQRAPNRAGATEKGRGLGADLHYKDSRDKYHPHHRAQSHSWSDERDHRRSDRDRRHHRSRSNDRDREYAKDRRYGRYNGRSRSRSNERGNKDDKRDADSVFKERPVTGGRGIDDLRNIY